MKAPDWLVRLIKRMFMPYLTEPVVTEDISRKRTVTVREATMFLDGATIAARNDDGWLHIEVTAAPDIIGYAVSVNGKDLPFISDDPGNDEIEQRRDRK